MAVQTGTSAADLLDGTGSDDHQRGSAGGDLLNGAAGNDTQAGGEGDDRISGGAGNDVIYGFGASDRQPGSGDIRATLVAGGFDQPVFATAAPGDPDRLFVVEKSGQIRILDLATGANAARPFLDIPASEIQSDGEQGLLGLAFDPDYQNNGRFFVFVTNADGDLEVRGYTQSADNPDRADPDSGDVILTIPHPRFANHNGGWIGFGPDGYLYVSTGDGGGAGDPDNNAQNVDALLGKMLRIDVRGDDFPADAARDYAIPDDNPFNGSAGADEIWALGLRNAWRPSFDRETGDLYIADVGQNAQEEVNFQANGTPGGVNYGWVVREGGAVFDPDRPGNPDPASPDLTDPVMTHPHQGGEDGGFSVTGGYVYRGTGAGMQGVYLYADFETNQVWSFRVVDGVAVDAANRTDQLARAGGTIANIASFAEDGQGNLYVISFGGDIHLLTPQAGAGDGDDILRGGAGNDRVHGGAGDDRVTGDAGNDTLFGNGQDDALTGGSGRDVMHGGAGADAFVFMSVADSGTGGGRDVVADFDAGDDSIVLAGIDARAGQDGDQRFTYIGADSFTAEGQIRAVQAGDDVILSLNTTGAGGADMQMILRGVLVADLSAGSFDL